jgi:hypothetical protein
MDPMKTLSQPRARLLLAGVGGAAAGALVIAVIGTATRGCGTAARVRDMDQRVARLESALGLGDAEAPPSADTLPATPDGGIPSADEETTAVCALAKVAAYHAWQDAYVRAKALAAPAQAACADAWSERRKQSCWYAASAGVRTTQAARDAVILGDGAAHDAVKNVKDDPKNEVIARARAASEKAFTDCKDESGSP